MMLDNIAKINIDPVTGVGAKVTNDGRLLTSNQIIISDDKTAVIEGGVIALTGNGGTNTFTWIIPNNEIFELLSFEFGGFVPDASVDGMVAKCLLYYQPNGNTTGELLLDAIYLQGQSDARIPLALKQTGDGIKQIVMIVANESDKQGEFKRFIKGYY